MMITNRTKSKALLLKDKYKDLLIGANPEEVAAHSDLIFICVKPLDIPHILEQINPHVTPDKCLISITSPVNTSQIEQRYHVQQSE